MSPEEQISSRRFEGTARIGARETVWADFIIAALVFGFVLLPLEYGGDSAVWIASVVAGAFLLLLLLKRLARRR